MMNEDAERGPLTPQRAATSGGTPPGLPRLVKHRQYLRPHSRRCSEQQQEIDDKLKEKDLLNQQISKKQADLQKLEADKEQKERQRSLLQEELARMGGMNNLNYAQVEADYVRAEKEQVDADTHQ